MESQTAKIRKLAYCYTETQFFRKNELMDTSVLLFKIHFFLKQISDLITNDPSTQQNWTRLGYEAKALTTVKAHNFNYLN